MHHNSQRDKLYCLYFKRYTLCVPFVFLWCPPLVGRNPFVALRHFPSQGNLLALVELRHRRIVGCHCAFKQSTRHPPCFGRFHSVKTILNYFHLCYHNSQRDKLYCLYFKRYTLCVPFVFLGCSLQEKSNAGI